MDLPAQRHLRLQLLPALLHDRAHVDDGAVAQSERGLRAAYRRRQRSADPDRHHDLRADHQQRHDGDGGQFRLSPRPPQDGGPDAADGGARRHLRRHAGVRMDQADHGRRAALGQSVGRGAVRLDLLHDHRLPRHPCDHRRDLPAHHRAQGLARRLRRRDDAASSPAGGATTRASRSWASTGTSSIWSGCSSSHSSISGEEADMAEATADGHGHAARCSGVGRVRHDATAASDQALSGGLGMAVHPQRLLLRRSIISGSRAISDGR